MQKGLNLKQLYKNESSFEETINENLFIIDNFTFLSISSKITSSSKKDIKTKELYLITDNKDTEFKDKTNQIVCINDKSIWYFYVPKEGCIAYLKSDEKFIYYNGIKWIDFNVENIDKNNNFLKKDNNFSDISNKELARNNLNIYSKNEIYNKSEVDEKIKNISIDTSDCLKVSKCLLDIPDQDTACHNIGTLRDWEIRRIGDYKISSLNFDHDYWYICDGREMLRSEYPEIFKIIGTNFGAGNGTTTFNLPDFRNKTIWGANNNLNQVKTSGLPNITGDLFIQQGTQKWGFCCTNSGAISSGAFYTNGEATCNQMAGYGTLKSSDITHFSASKSNPIYGASNIVQPPAICVNIFIKVK